MLLALEMLAGRTRSMGSNEFSRELIGLLGPTSTSRAECTLEERLSIRGFPASEREVDELPATDILEDVMISAFS
jgi:hypothetical protein